MGEAEALPKSLVTLKCGSCGAGHPWEALSGLKQNSWSPWRLGLPFLGTHTKSKSPKFLAAPGPGKFEGRKKEEKCFRLRS